MWGSRQFCIYTLYTHTKNVWKSKIFKTFSAVWWNNIHQHCCLFLLTSADISGSLTVTLSALVPFNSEVHFNTSAGLVESDQRWWAQWFVSGWTAPPGDRKAETWRHTKLLVHKSLPGWNNPVYSSYVRSFICSSWFKLPWTKVCSYFEIKTKWAARWNIKNCTSWIFTVIQIIKYTIT